MTPLPVQQFKNMHVIYSCGYFIALNVDYNGPVSRQLFVYKADPNDLTNVPKDPTTILEFASDQGCFYEAHILGNHILVHRKITKSVDQHFPGAFTQVRAYDLKQSAIVPIAEFSVDGHVLVMNEHHMAIVLKGILAREVYLLEWRKASGIVGQGTLETRLLNDGRVLFGAISENRLLCYHYQPDDNYRSFSLWDLKKKEIILEYGDGENAFDMMNNPVCFNDDFCFILGSQYCTVFSLEGQGGEIRRFSIGQSMNIEPILDQDGRPCGRYYIEGTLSRGILDVCSPLLNRRFEVIVLPAVHSIKAAADKIQRKEVVYGDLNETLLEICESADHLDIESQVLLLENKSRYILVFNCHGESKETPSRIVKKLLLRAKLLHSENCPIHCVGLDQISGGISTRLDGEDANILQTRRGYGPSILMYEEWSESYGWVPANVPASFDLKKFKKKMK
eukprot:TRINITY_DN4478_c0_g1_i1.p1 TRINITY_DN4478_c0_g1~~TRINITY_DN4478_c0_g1_i1.p1  ORF type:complete len:450 (-),score=31.07 TRINITY_DN4478_c0_g1_i1:126-1475(-)